MPKTTGVLIHQNEPVEDVALTTLAARTALQIAADFSAIAATFLIKRVRYFLTLQSVATNEGPFMVALAQGDVTAAEASAAFTEGNTAGPSDRSQTLSQDESWNVYQASVEKLMPADSGGFHQSSGQWINMPGRGIPAPEGAGWQAIVFNADNAALTTGSIIKGIIQYQGVWLRD